MSAPLGVTLETHIGHGSQGTVWLGRVEIEGPEWMSGNVAIKTWDHPDNGAAIALDSVRALKALPSDALLALVDDELVMPVALCEGCPPVVIMPIGTDISNRDWRHVLAAVKRLADSPTNIVHLDVKAKNMMWHNGAVKFIDHEALCVAGKRASGLPSYAPWVWRRWGPDINIPQTRDENPEQYDDAYFTAYSSIQAEIGRDRDGGIATLLWGGLASALSMTTGVGDPVVTQRAVEQLQCPMAIRMWEMMVYHFKRSAVAAMGRKLNALRTSEI